MNNFFKRPLEGNSETNDAKRARVGNNLDDDINLLTSPRVIAAWNCNGLTSRLRNDDTSQIKAFIEKYKPDVFFLSEVRVCAANNSSSGKPGPNTKWFRSRMKDSDKKSLVDVKQINELIFSKQLRHYTPYFSLADTKYSGTAMFVNTKRLKIPKVRYNLHTKDLKASIHNPEGRVIYARFQDFAILHTYVPNNGWDEKHFARRKAWDDRVLQFLKEKNDKQIPVMWIGDLNVAPLDVDLSHPKHYKKQTGGRNGKRGANEIPIAPENVGQPGCTPAERKRFNQILHESDMVDAYRSLVGPEHCSGFTWRGTTTGIHAGRGMRIDHCIVSKTLLPNVDQVLITGHGTDRNGFLGSDHCPVVVEMVEEKATIQLEEADQAEK